VTAPAPRPQPTWFERALLDRLTTWRADCARIESEAAEHLAAIRPPEPAGPEPYRSTS
jgi:hypothetical protein